MRISVPNLPLSPFTTAKRILSSTSEAISRLVDFIIKGNVTVLTGAGVSVDSGIRAYRGHDGRYMNPNYRPIFYHELIDPTEKGHYFRQRYWLRSYLGYPPVRDAAPNTTHLALAALQHTLHISSLITQNVDGLHHKALSYSSRHHQHFAQSKNAILELHGTLHRVHCRSGHVVDRDLFQNWISAANVPWKEFMDEAEQSPTSIRTNPDGDVDIEHLGINYKDFVVPDCPSCFAENRRTNIHKPGVIFFGESIPTNVKDQSFRQVEMGDRLLVIGTSLATYSAFRLLKHAVELKKPVLLLNVGPTRADGYPGVGRLDIPTGAIMTDVATAVIGSRTNEDPVLLDLFERAKINKLRKTQG